MTAPSHDHTPSVSAEEQVVRHTSGPWIVVEGDISRRVYMPNDVLSVRTQGRENLVASLYRVNHSATGEVDAANARLIAAAPDLLAALREHLDAHQPPTSAKRKHAAFVAARAAIAKASGE